MPNAGWIAVDFDGVLAEYHGWNHGALELPVPRMVERVKAWLAEGKEVRVFTARVAGSGMANHHGQTDNQEFVDSQRQAIEAWCELHIGQPLKVTATKDFQMVALYDDRAFRVEMNTGEIIGGLNG